MRFILCLLFFAAHLFGQDQEIRIYLSTTSNLEPLYFAKIENNGSAFDKQYLAELEKVFLFDLSHNGSTKPMAASEQKESIIHQQNLSSAFNPNLWKSLGVAYVVRASVKEKAISVTLFSSQTGSLKQFSDIPLTGNLSHDRRQIHKVADSLYKSLYGEEGVASTRILFAQKQKPAAGSSRWNSEIWCCDWDGANAKQITHEGSYSITPVFLPANQKHLSDRFIYVSYKVGQPKIFIATLGQGKGERLLDLKGHQILPAISPQRDKIAFISDAGGRTDLFMQRFDPNKGEAGQPVQLFSYPRATQASPTFSPDGSTIAFVSDKDGSPRIYLIPAHFEPKRASPQLITKQNNENSCPSWSPDGKKLAYSAKTKGVRQIWIYDFDTKEEKQLTDGAGNKENPSWAPDSKHLVFNSTDGSTSDLYLVNLNQPEVVKITQGSSIKHYPTWGR